MLFNSIPFLLYFLPIAYIVYWLLKTKQQRYVWLTAAGYVFYGAWNWKFCGLMAFSTLVSYTAGLLMLHWDFDPRRRRLCLIVPVTVDLLLLGFFKYTNFTLSNVSVVLSWLGTPVRLPMLKIVLPVGISFYTFHTISYMVDSYRRTITPTRNLFEFSCYVSLFSQLVAGPIVRFRQIEEDLEHLGQIKRGLWENRAWSFLIIGMVQKVILADSIAAIINPSLKSYLHLSTLSAWMYMLGYTYQLYFDFAGYSNMAVGLGLLFGLRIPQNFDSPYKADGIPDFWRRWHISLSSCLRDYVYIPLGGNRGTTAQVYRNLMITMLLGGAWHGANWTFVVWGGYHGMLLALSRRFHHLWTALPRRLRQCVTFLLVVVGWVFFRSDNMRMAWVILQRMFVPQSGIVPQFILSLGVLLGFAAGAAHFGKNTFEMRHEWGPWASAALAAAFLLCLLRIYSAQTSPFLYFQF